MTSGIRFPQELRLPDRDGYGDVYAEGRTAFQPDTGAVRRRNRFTVTPRIFDVQWSFTQAELYAFDWWVQNTIEGGALKFDIQLLDDDQTLVWYTVNAVGQYSYDIQEPEAEPRYVVQWKLCALDNHFGEFRPAGTDELRGFTGVGVTGRGALQVAKALHGFTGVGVSSATGRLNLPPLYGTIEVGMKQLPILVDEP